MKRKDIPIMIVYNPDKGYRVVQLNKETNLYENVSGDFKKEQDAIDFRKLLEKSTGILPVKK